MKKKYLFSPKPGYIYVRVKGKHTRITAPEGTAEFDRQYWEILSGKNLEAATSWSALIKSYRASDRWTNLKALTREGYERVLLYIEEKNGAKDMTRVRRKDVIAAQQANLHRVRFANSIAAVMSVLCEHAIDIGWIRENPAKGVRKIATPKEKQKPHIPWTDEAVAKMRAEARPMPRLIFELGVGSVQRPGDLVEFCWGDYDGDSLTLRQNKTDKPLKLPCTPQLKAALDQARAALGVVPHPSRRILTGRKGDPLTYSGMAQMMRKERRRLGLEAYDQHAMRYRGVMELAWAGCDDDEIASYSGHASKAMIIKYAGEARQIMRAKQAWKKRQ
ncbi:site-specific integrase [Paracoccus siganidrum]|uniref:site-specific integrase n=1 Tax=Paracoccus siganidrum TaxID=1276757 RepID=UPI001F0CCAEA|nr:tyrosine-type recombinase/integrase [Paracoccus siganidrum]